MIHLRVLRWEHSPGLSRWAQSSQGPFSGGGRRTIMRKRHEMLKAGPRAKESRQALGAGQDKEWILP